MGQTFHSGELIPTPNFRFSRDQAGLWTGSQEYHCPKNEVARLIPGRGEPHHFMTFMGVSKVQIVGMAGKLVKMSVEYAGYQPGDSQFGERESDLAEYTLGLSTSEEPIETHPRYDALSDFDIQEARELALNPPKSEDGKKIKEVDTTAWPALKLELFQDLRKGIEAYREPRVTWTKRWVSDTRPDDLNRIGEIDTPEGNPPAPAAGRNWLNAGITSRERGEVFENELVWELSGRGGWSTRYYQD